MGYHQHQQSESSGAVVAIVAAVLIVAVLGILVVAVAGLFWVRTSTVQSRAVAAEHLAVAEMQRAVAVAQVQQQSSVMATPVPRLSFEVKLDREGNASIDGKGIDLDDLRAHLAKLKDETSNTFSVRINADSECPVKLVVPVLDVIEEVGDIDFRIASARDTAIDSEAERTHNHGSAVSH
ncbi:MAG: biopolymer transporter ExbD [Pirellulaceae bacterium]|jgi:biopolymer transport protein ExbD|nr:biopolymer transporter ExbD [Pirellulaceae bacterium]